MSACIVPRRTHVLALCALAALAIFASCGLPTAARALPRPPLRSPRSTYHAAYCYCACSESPEPATGACARNERTCQSIGSLRPALAPGGACAPTGPTSPGPLAQLYCVCVFKAPRTLDPVLRAFVSPRGTRERLGGHSASPRAEFGFLKRSSL